MKEKLPGASNTLVWGIVSLVMAFCFAPFSIIAGIVALTSAKKPTNLHAADPNRYDGIGNVKTGKILGIIGLVVSVISIAASIYMFSTGAYDEIFQQLGVER